MQTALDAFADDNGMTDHLLGHRDFEARSARGRRRQPPDIAMLPQPGASPRSRAVATPFHCPTTSSPGRARTARAVLDGVRQRRRHPVRRAVKSDLKSLVWYIPAAFAEKGYEVPTTLDDFFALTQQMIANGDTPLCVGIESEPATGWPFTDWVEELILREQGIDYYNQWVAHEIPFNSPEVVEHPSRSIDLWNTEGMMYASGGSIVSTDFQENAEPLVNGDCMMHRQANFFAAFFPREREFGDGEGQVNTSTSRPTRASRADRRQRRGGVPRRARGVGRDAVPRLAGVHQRPPDGAGGDLAGGLSGYLTANPNADTIVFNDVEQGSSRSCRPPPGRLRRFRPHAGGGRVGRSGPRPRRSSTATYRPGGRRQHRGLLAGKLTATPSPSADRPAGPPATTGGRRPVRVSLLFRTVGRSAEGEHDHDDERRSTARPVAVRGDPPRQGAAAPHPAIATLLGLVFGRLGVAFLLYYSGRARSRRRWSRSSLPWRSRRPCSSAPTSCSTSPTTGGRCSPRSPASPSGSSCSSCSTATDCSAIFRRDRGLWASIAGVATGVAMLAAPCPRRVANARRCRRRRRLRRARRAPLRAVDDDVATRLDWAKLLVCTAIGLGRLSAALRSRRGRNTAPRQRGVARRSARMADRRLGRRRVSKVARSAKH